MRDDTKLIRLGRGPVASEGTVNLPVYRASTILSTDLDAYIHRFDGDRAFENVTYGASGTHNARALAQAIAELEGGHAAVVTGSGLSAICMTLAALLSAGDHILVSDSVYGPTRRYCKDILSRFGVQTTFYDPCIGADIINLIRDNTRLVFMEVPGSLSFEMQDIPAITDVSKSRGILTVMDNTWATPMFFKPLAHGVDVSIQAGTKYIAGHSDLVIGIVTTASEALYRSIATQARICGDVAGPDDCYLTLRGMRTLAVRLRHQQASALVVAAWLVDQAAVDQVLFPALESDAGHAIWKRDFEGAASLFGVALQTTDECAVKRMVDSLDLFQIGSSWGGFESLVAFNHMPVEREVVPWTRTPFLLRFHIGLEDPQDLIEDLERGMARLA